MTALGIIEGFYGRMYSYEERVMLLNFLHKNDFNFYIYAPKNDKSLRTDYLKEHDKNIKDELKKVSNLAHELNISFGMGISPINLTNEYESKKDVFINRVLSLINDFDLKIIALLFDDVLLDKEDLGKRQNKIIKDIEAILPDTIEKFIVCPSYYTDDDMLDRLFGQRPKSYYEDFAQDLQNKTKIFWTGPKVLSQDISVDDVKRAQSYFNKDIFLWDNYPVNDGKKFSNFLYLDKFNGRTNLDNKVAGHAINPMLEPMLSTLSMLTLPLIYKGMTSDEIDARYVEYAHELFGQSADKILENIELLTKKGLNNLTTSDKELLLKIVEKDLSKKANQEIKDFLNNKYEFDPACLTE